MAQLLSDEVLRSVYKAALARSLDRGVLLSGLPASYQAVLTEKPTRAAQYLLDLQTLNRAPPLSDGTVPLAAWLEMADLLSVDFPENAIFLAAKAALATPVSTGGDVPEPLPVPTGPQPGADRALADFLLSAFSADELRRFLRWLDGNLSARLPGPNASLATLVDDAVALLMRERLVDADFFARLKEERPRRAEEIEAVRVKFGV